MRKDKILVMDSGQNFFTWVELGKFFVAQVWSGRFSHLWLGFGFGKFPLKIPNTPIFSLQVRKYCFGLDKKVPG